MPVIVKCIDNMWYEYPTATGWTISSTEIMLNIIDSEGKVLATFNFFILVQDYKIEEEVK